MHHIRVIATLWTGKIIALTHIIPFSEILMGCQSAMLLALALRLDDEFAIECAIFEVRSVFCDKGYGSSPLVFRSSSLPWPHGALG